MSTKKIIILAVVFIIVICGSIGFYMFNKTFKNIANANPDIIVSDDQIFSEFEKNETTATKKFVTGDPIIEVSGVIAEITQNADTTTTIVFQNPAKYTGDISCTIVKTDVEKTKKLKQREKVTIKGQCSGMQELIDKEVILIRCIICDNK